MTRYSVFISLFLLTLACAVGQSQNLYDSGHSRQFADYLLTTQQYQLASVEFERVVLMEPENSEARQKLIFSYRQSKDYSSALKKLHQWYPTAHPDAAFAEEWIKLLLLNQSYTAAAELLHRQESLSPLTRQYYQLANFLLSGEWEQACSFLQEPRMGAFAGADELLMLAEQKQNLKYKSPALSLALSAVVPGLGKVYAKDWKDGVISLLFVATNAWQAYRGFSKDGTDSVYGWVFASMAVGFYGSGLYGSWKSAQAYNVQLDHDLYHEIESTVYSRF